VVVKTRLQNHNRRKTLKPLKTIKKKRKESSAPIDENATFPDVHAVLQFAEG
jgi:hypothetical protein